VLLVADAVETDVKVVPVPVLELVPAFEYTSSLFPAPQYSFLLPSQGMEQSVVAAKTLPALREFPQ
jgi:hypothetical protein